MSRAHVFEWHKWFSEGRESVKDDDRPGRPCTAVTDDNIEKVRDVIRKEGRLGVRAIAEEVSLDREIVRRILREELKMRKVCAKMVPKLLSDEQKERRKKLCLELLQRIENEPDLLTLIITCDETWVFTYDPETKRQSIQWKSTPSSRPKKHAWVVRRSRSCWPFLWYPGYSDTEWVPTGQTINQQYYIEVFKKLRESVRRERPELWRNGWTLNQDNAPAHNELSVKQFLTNKNITVLSTHPTRHTSLPATSTSSQRSSQCSKALILCREKMWKQKTAEILNCLTEHDLRNCFEYWQHRMQLCVNSQGNYFEGVRSWFLNLLNRKSYWHSLVFCVGPRIYYYYLK